MVMRISKNRSDEQGSGGGGRSPGLELWLKDGDQAIVQIVSSGDPSENEKDADTRLDDFYIHTIQTQSDTGGRAFRQLLCNPLTYNSDDECPHCADGKNPGHQFGIWCYVYYILHNDQRQDDWEPIKNNTGVVKYKQTVNNFMVFAKGFGRGDYLWNQVADIYNEQEGLNKFITRIKRSGSGLRDTSYVIAVTNQAATWSDEQLGIASQLPPVKEFFSRKYGAVESDPESLMEETNVTAKNQAVPAVSDNVQIETLLDSGKKIESLLDDEELF